MWNSYGGGTPTEPEACSPVILATASDNSPGELLDSAATVLLVATAIPTPVLVTPSFPSYPRSSKSNMQYKGRNYENLGVYDSNLERENLKNHDYTLL
jgi:hypothetical protein